MSYHLGLSKAGDRVVVEVADTVDQLNCELWRYFGEREITLARLKETAPFILEAIKPRVRDGL